MKRALMVGVSLIVVILAVVVGVAVFLYSSLDSLVKNAVEKYGTEIVQAKVTLDEVKIEATSGRGRLHGFSVGNPSGFETPKAFAFELVGIELDAGTLTQDVIVIKQIVIAKPQITYELGASGNNIDVLRRNVDDYVKAHGGGGEKSAEAEEGKGPRLVIENLYVREGVIGVSANVPTLAGRQVTTRLPDIHLTGLGKEQGGSSPGEVTERVLDEIGKRAAIALQEIGVGKTLESLKEGLGSAAEGAKSQATDALKGVTEGGTGVSLKDATGGAGDKLKKLFGN